MTNPSHRRLATASIALILGWASLGPAQGPSKGDNDLDELLNKVEEASKPKDDPAKPAKPGQVTGKDKDLDDFLQKLGEPKDTPSADGKPPEAPPGGGAADDKKSNPGGGEGKKGGEKDADKGGDPSKDKKSSQSKAKGSGLTGEDKDLDEHLAGVKKKQGQGQGKGQGQKKGEEDGPLGDLIKQMREVEQRLGKPDTGEQTRQKQTEIVKKMDGLIEKMRLVRTQSQMMRQIRQGQQPGQQPGQQAGANAQGAQPMRPATPKPKSVVAVDKNPWGHLPPDLRAEMDNVFKEEGLPEKLDLIKRYYLSVSKKSLSREE